MLVYKLSGCEFESRCRHLNSRYRTCFEQRDLWHSGNCRVRIHFERYTSHFKNMPNNIFHIVNINYTGVFRGKNMLAIILQNKAIKIVHHQQHIRILLDKVYWKVFVYSKIVTTKLLFLFLLLFLLFHLFLCPLRRCSLCTSMRQMPCLPTSTRALPIVLSFSLTYFWLPKFSVD